MEYPPIIIAGHHLETQNTYTYTKAKTKTFSPEPLMREQIVGQVATWRSFPGYVMFWGLEVLTRWGGGTSTKIRRTLVKVGGGTVAASSHPRIRKLPAGNCKNSLPQLDRLLLYIFS